MMSDSVNLGAGYAAGQGSLPETEPDVTRDSASKKRNKRSKAWTHFTIQNDDPNHANCNYCNAVLGCKSTSAGTASLVNHLKICKKNPAHIGSNQSELTYQVCADGNSVVPWQYIEKEVREAFARMIVIDELPFIFAEKEGFRFFMSKACPRFTVPSRTTMYRDIIALYEAEKAMLRKYFIDSRQTVCLTIDTWTSKRQQSYMVLTAHFIDSGWNLRKKIISFVLVDGHKGDDIGKSLEKLLIEWGIERVCTITVDNASSNDTCLAYMKRSLTNRGCTHAKSLLLLPSRLSFFLFLLFLLDFLHIFFAHITLSTLQTGRYRHQARSFSLVAVTPCLERAQGQKLQLAGLVAVTPCLERAQGDMSKENVKKVKKKKKEEKEAEATGQ